MLATPMPSSPPWNRPKTGSLSRKRFWRIFYLYGSEENREKAKEMGDEVIVPTMGTPKEDTITLADFSQNEKEKIVA